MKINNYLTAMLATATPSEIRKVLRAVNATGFDLNISTEITDETFNFYLNDELVAKVYYKIDGMVLEIEGCECLDKLIADRNKSLFTERMMMNLPYKFMHDAALRLSGLTGAMFWPSAAMMKFNSMMDATARYINDFYFYNKDKNFAA